MSHVVCKAFNRAFNCVGFEKQNNEKRDKGIVFAYMTLKENCNRHHSKMI